MREFARALYHSSAWRKLREYVIRRDDGLCQRCKGRGVLKPGDIVHHIIPLTPENVDDQAIALNAENLEYVCKDCHEIIHIELEQGALNHRIEEPRVAFDSEGNVVEL